MQNKKILVGLLSALTIFGSTQLFAGNRAGATTLTLGDGYYMFSKKSDLDNVMVPNIGLAYNFNEHWGLEGNIGLINTNYKTSTGRVGAHGFLYTVDGLYHLAPYGIFEPYLSAGVGDLGLTPPNKGSVHQANVNAGIGTQIFLDNSIALRGEVKDVYVLRGGKNDVMFNLGVSFLFGGNDVQPVVMPVAQPTTYKDDFKGEDFKGEHLHAKHAKVKHLKAHHANKAKHVKVQKITAKHLEVKDVAN
jgi:hypothetical protein